MTLTVAPVCCTASKTVSKIGDFLGEELASLAGSDPGDDLAAVIEGELCVLGAEAAGDALDQDAGLRGD